MKSSSTILKQEMVRLTKATVTTSSKPRSFATLDALRGVAALPVVTIHSARAFGGSLLFPHGFLAVDFFFLLSGFVMTYVYQEKLDAGWPLRSFMKVRILRLYPLYFIGLVFGAVFMMIRSKEGNHPIPISLVIEFTILGLCFFPRSPAGVQLTVPNGIFPLNPPAWSLFYELVGNFLHALFMRRRSLRVIGCFVASQAALMLWLGSRAGTLNQGFDRSQYLIGFSRILFSYPCGAMLYTLWNRGKLRIHVHPLACRALLVGLLAVRDLNRFAVLYEWLVVTLCFPLILCMAATVQPSRKLAPIATWLGALSYPIYILHTAIFAVFEQVWTHIAHHRIEKNAPLAGVIFLSVLIPTSFWIGRNYDPEARKLIQMRLLPWGKRVVTRRARLSM